MYNILHNKAGFVTYRTHYHTSYPEILDNSVGYNLRTTEKIVKAVKLVQCSREWVNIEQIKQKVMLKR